MGRDFGQYGVVKGPQKCRSPELPQMENRDLGWIGLGLGTPKTLFSAKKRRFSCILATSHYLGVPPWGASTVFFYLSGPCKSTAGVVGLELVASLQRSVSVAFLEACSGPCFQF